MDNNTIDQVITKYQSEKGSLISILHDIQREEGHIPEEIMCHLSDRLKLPLSEVFRVVTYFDKAFLTKPQQKHSIRVCQGTACHLKHADHILSEIKETLGEDEEAGYRNIEERTLQEDNE